MLDHSLASSYERPSPLAELALQAVKDYHGCLIRQLHDGCELFHAYATIIIYTLYSLSILLLKSTRGNYIYSRNFNYSKHPPNVTVK